MVVLSADHHVEHVDKFVGYLQQAIVAAEAGFLTTIGLAPTRPETGYGYLHLGERQTQLGPDVYQVKQFTEKPDLEKATRMLESGQYLWNGGMFAWKAQTLLDALERCLPDLAETFKPLDAAIDTPDMNRVLDEIFEKAEKISVDYGVMERSDQVMTVAAEGIGWDDLGSWTSFERLNLKDEQGNVVKGNHVLVDTKSTIVASKDGLIVTIGVSDLVIVRRGDAVLVARKDCARQLKEVLQQMESDEELRKHL